MPHDMFTELGDFSIHLADPIELFDVIKNGEQNSKRQIEQAQLNNAFTPRILDAQDWLPLAAEKYKISASLQDYVIIPVSIMPTELPNRNGVGFPFEELTAFNPEYKMPAFKTWKGSPTYKEHKNDNIVEAKGIILDTSMRKLPSYEGDHWHVINLLAFDRSKDADLVSEILAKKRASYSMGAFVRDYECSICAKTVKNGGCDHVKRGKANYSLYNDRELAYFRAIEPVGFETSSVEVPAYITASNPDFRRMWGKD